MSKWHNTTLGDIATYVNGYAFKSSDWSDSGLEIIRIQNLTKGSASINYFAGSVKEKYKVRRGDILISWSGSLGVYEWQNEDAWLNQHLFKVVFDKVEVSKSFFKHLMAVSLMKLESQVHGATMKHITKKKFDSLPIYLPPLEEQKKIAAILDAADNYRQKTKALIDKYNQLTQSLFLDMFGDPVTNPRDWNLVTLPDIVKKDKHSLKRGPFGGALKKEIFVEDGFKVYEQGNAIAKSTEVGRYHIDESKFREMSPFQIKPGDFIVSCSGTIGKIYKLPVNCPKGIINQALMKIDVDPDVIISDYFEAVFNFFIKDHIFISSSKGSGLKNVASMKIIKEGLFICPPKTVQIQFAERIAQIEKQKQQAEASLAKAEELFSSLLQRAFKGELTS